MMYSTSAGTSSVSNADWSNMLQRRWMCVHTFLKCSRYLLSARDDSSFYPLLLMRFSFDKNSFPRVSILSNCELIN